MYRPLVSNNDCTTCVLLNQSLISNNGTFGRSSVNIATFCTFNISPVMMDLYYRVLLCFFPKELSHQLFVKNIILSYFVFMFRGGSLQTECLPFNVLFNPNII